MDEPVAIITGGVGTPARAVADTLERCGFTIAVIGLGTMGRGIAQTLAQAGYTVALFDRLPGAAESARSAIDSLLGRLVDKGKLTADGRRATMERLIPCAALADLSQADLLVEAIVEDIAAKRALIAELEGIVPAHAILASNTSSLSITALAAGARHPERIAGWHFFNPVPLMRLAEVVGGLLTAPAVLDRLADITQAIGHTAVRVKDSPGFLVNHVGRAYTSEALRILAEGVADYPAIDRIMRHAAGFRMGPFALMDLMGLNVTHAVMESLYHQFYEEPRFRITPLVGQRVAAGLFGRSSGRGFYDYSEGAAAPEMQHAGKANRPATLPRVPVWVCPQHPDLADKLTQLLVQLNVEVATGTQAPPDALILATPVGADTTTTSLAMGLDPARTVSVDMLFSMARCRTVMPSPATLPGYTAAAAATLGLDGVGVEIIRDSPGFVAQRVCAMITAIGGDIAQQRIAAPADIDAAARVALNYPDGPLAMGNALGTSRVLEVLKALHDCHGDPRYRPSAWLTRRARLGLSFLHED